jgi:hypothetical protein
MAPHKAGIPPVGAVPAGLGPQLVCDGHFAPAASAEAHCSAMVDAKQRVGCAKRNAGVVNSPKRQCQWCHIRLSREKTTNIFISAWLMKK